MLIIFVGGWNNILSGTFISFLFKYLLYILKTDIGPVLFITLSKPEKGKIFLSILNNVSIKDFQNGWLVSDSKIQFPKQDNLLS